MIICRRLLVCEFSRIFTNLIEFDANDYTSVEVTSLLKLGNKPAKIVRFDANDSKFTEKQSYFSICINIRENDKMFTKQ